MTNRNGIRILKDTDKMCGNDIPKPYVEPRYRYREIMADALEHAGLYFPTEAR